MHKKFTFKNSAGTELAGRLELPKHPTRQVALFAHCFTCGKDIHAASRISRELAARGLAVLRFDFTGLGNSQGDFGNSNFSTNVQDLLSASRALEDSGYEVKLLIGHSLGGAAVLACAHQLPGVQAVVTIGAPAEPRHVEHLLTGRLEAIEEGEAEVKLGARTFTIKKQFLDDIREHSLREKIGSLGKALLVFHAPLDNTVGIENAAAIYQAAKHPKSFVSLDSADHLLSDPADSAYVADVVAAWVSRYLTPEEHLSSGVGHGDVRVSSWGGKFTQLIRTEKHQLLADEPAELGGDDRGPNPYELLLSALGACTAMTLQMYADRKNWPLQEAAVTLKHSRIHAEDCRNCTTETGKLELIERELSLQGDLSEQQRQRLLEIADKCPVHRTLLGEKEIHTQLKS